MTSSLVKCGLVILLSLTSSTQWLSSTGRNRYTEAYNYIHMLQNLCTTLLILYRSVTFFKCCLWMDSGLTWMNPVISVLESAKVYWRLPPRCSLGMLPGRCRPPLPEPRLSLTRHTLSTTKAVRQHWTQKQSILMLFRVELHTTMLITSLVCWIVAYKLLP